MYRTCLLAAALLAAAGCRSNPDWSPSEEGSFASLHSYDRDEAISAAIGDASVTPLLLVQNAQFANESDARCPMREVTGSAVTYRASDCTNTELGHYDGVLYARNAPTELSDVPFDADLPLKVEVRDWSDASQRHDGVVDRTIASPASGDAYTQTVAYALDADSSHWRYETYGECVHYDDGDDCTIEGAIELPSIQFEFDGTYGRSGALRRGEVTLRGVDTLVVDFDEETNYGCAPYTIDGEPTGTYCY